MKCNMRSGRQVHHFVSEMFLRHSDIMLLETVYTVGEHEHCKLGQGHVMTLIHSYTSFISYLVTESIFVVITRLTGQTEGHTTSLTIKGGLN